MLEKIKNYNRDKLFFIQENEDGFYFIKDVGMGGFNGWWYYDDCIKLNKKDYNIEQIQEIIIDLYGEKLHYFHPKEREKGGGFSCEWIKNIHEKWKIWYLNKFVDDVYVEEGSLEPFKINFKSKKKNAQWYAYDNAFPWARVRIKDEKEFQRVKRNYEEYKTQKIRNRKYQEYLADIQ